jgi:hypothetical protein
MPQLLARLWFLVPGRRYRLLPDIRDEHDGVIRGEHENQEKQGAYLPGSCSRCRRDVHVVALVRHGDGDLYTVTPRCGQASTPHGPHDQPPRAGARWRGLILHQNDQWR